MDSSKVFRLLYTTEDVRELVSGIESIQAAIYKGKADFDKELHQSVSSLFTEIFETESQGNWEKYLDDLKQELLNLKVLEITIGTELNRNSLEEIGDVAKKFISDRVVLDILVERSILGGAILSINGKYKDYSLKSEVDAWFRQRGGDL
jgi:hypothetical protein